MAKILYTNGKVEEVKPANGKWFTLEEKQKIVGGNIEIAESREGNWIVLNEDGKGMGLPVNKAATLMYKYGLLFDKEGNLRLYDIIVGDVLYCTEKELSKPER